MSILQALNRLEGKLSHEDVIIICIGACMYVDEVLQLMQLQNPQCDTSHFFCLGGIDGPHTSISNF